MTQEPIRIPLLRDWHSHPLLYAAFMDGIDLNRDPAGTRDEAVGRIRKGVSHFVRSFSMNEAVLSVEPAITSIVYRPPGMP